MAADARRLFLAKAEKCFLHDFAGPFDVAENPHSVTDEMTFVLVQRSHDPCGFRRVFHPCLTSINVPRRHLLDMHNEDFVQWLEALERRHLTNLNFSEVRRAVQALSSLYVERRDRIETGSALNGAGKRAAFAM